VGEPGNCSITGAVGSQVLHCNDGPLAPGASASVDVRSATTSASAGHYTNTATASATNAPSVQASATVVVQGTALAITTTTLPGGTVNESYSTPVAATGGATPYLWSISAGALPAGLGIDTANGVISGSPTASGTSDFTVKVTDASSPTAQTATAALSITISPLLAVTTTALPEAPVGQAYSTTLSATGGTPPYAWNLSPGPLPSGLTLDSATGVISGNPKAAGTVNFGVEVTDSSPVPEHATASLSITTTAAPPIVSKVSPPTGDTSGGTTVTITGSGFTGATQVVFGTSGALAMNVVNDTTITATSPHELPGVVDVMVFTSAGPSVANPADQFTYTTAQTPVTVSCDPNCTATASSDLNDTTVTVTGTTGTSSSQVSLVVNTGAVACGTRNYSTAVSTLSATGFSPSSLLTVKEIVGNEPSIQGVKVCFEPSGSSTGIFLRPCHLGHVPCLVSLTEDSGTVVATFLVPANDPRFWAGGAPVALKSFSPMSAGPGTSVTVRGKNLTAVVSVVMGGVEAAIVSDSPTKLVVTVPAGAVTGLISVTSASGTATSVTPFTVT
jgi:hypothetical protein